MARAGLTAMMPLCCGKARPLSTSLGQIGFDPGSEWGTGLTSTADNTLRRVSTICAGDPNGSDPFDPSFEWEGFATDTFGGLGAHTANCGGPDAAPTVSSTYPADGATDFPINANLTVTFSEPVNVIDPWFTLSCSTSGAVDCSRQRGTDNVHSQPCGGFGYRRNLYVDFGSRRTSPIRIPMIRRMPWQLNFTVGFSPYDVCAQPYTAYSIHPGQRGDGGS